jgi:hypothetical protein
VKADTLKESCAAGCSGVGLEVEVELGRGDDVALDTGDRDGEADRVAVQPA